MTRKVTISQILILCSEYFEIPISVIIGPCRNQEIVKARFTVMYLCKLFVKANLCEIGRQIGGRVHTTIIHAIKTVRDSLSINDDYFSPHIDKLISIINYTPERECIPCFVVPMNMYFIKSPRPLIQTLESIYQGPLIA